MLPTHIVFILEYLVEDDINDFNEFKSISKKEKGVNK